MCNTCNVHWGNTYRMLESLKRSLESPRHRWEDTIKMEILNRM